jgi:hypothetical protein
LTVCHAVLDEFEANFSAFSIGVVLDEMVRHMIDRGVATTGRAPT